MDSYQDKKASEVGKKLLRDVPRNLKKRNVLQERFKFNTRLQEEGETAEEFAKDLQILAQSCAYGKFLEEKLRDNFVYGLRSARIKINLISVLIAEDEATFEHVRRTARGMELNEEKEKMMHPENLKTIAKIVHGKQKQPDEEGKVGKSYIKCSNGIKEEPHVAAEGKVATESFRRESPKKKEEKERDIYSNSDGEEDNEDRQDEGINSLRLGSILKEGKLRNHTPNEVEREGSVSDPVYIEVQSLSDYDDEVLTQ
ncbi:uncharacterized protein LOC129792523 isoform X2 [Lutzomyia longipalpis]|uniref:uncharacterized protein LOC129792523 isoform X2 n=1 Tax=Lutzomyia longipalpis TaxID=7200 RepID=UPI0024839F64|nr:uncharacterized protein LOC129792523 isoform X2 [Lutzomyia longipalpis]